MIFFYYEYLFPKFIKLSISFIILISDIQHYLFSLALTPESTIFLRSFSPCTYYFTLRRIIWSPFLFSHSWNEDDNDQPHTMKDSSINLKKVTIYESAFSHGHDFQNSELFHPSQKAMLNITAVEMSNFYEVAIDAKMRDEDIQICEKLLYEMLALNLSPTPTITKLIMGYYLKKSRYDEVLRIFESVPSWGGHRNFVHGSMVILALTHMGRLADAWKGAEMLHASDKFLSYDAARELFSRIILTLVDKVDKKDDKKEDSNTARKKLSKKTKVIALSTLICSLLRFHPTPEERWMADDTYVWSLNRHKQRKNYSPPCFICVLFIVISI